MIETCSTLEEDGVINFDEIFDKLDELIIIIPFLHKWAYLTMLLGDHLYGSLGGEHFS
jgi:hypothetical protein